jgi:hypothetical protein
MFEKIIPPAKGPTTWLHRDVKKMIVLVFGGVGRVLLGIGAAAVFLLSNFLYMAIGLAVVMVGGAFLVSAEYFRDKDPEENG